MPVQQTAKHLVHGQKAEALARKHLEAKGYQFIAQNFSCKLGEIDLIMLDNQQLVFVEVKARHSNRYGYPEEFVTPSKLRKILRTAQLFMQTHTEFPQSGRIDIISILGSTTKPQITHLIDASQ